MQTFLWTTELKILCVMKKYVHEYIMKYGIEMRCKRLKWYQLMENYI